MSPRPMTTYRSGLRTLRRTVHAPCVGCGKDQARSFQATSVDPEAECAAWLERFHARPVYCIPCWRKAGRPA